MLKHLTMISAEQLNYFPAKGGISAHFSPYAIIKRRSIDYAKHLRYGFGSYVQAFNENNPTNTNAPRTLDCIYLRPNSNRQGGHIVMDIATGRVITRSRVTVVPVSDGIIRAVERMAARDGIQTLKILDRNKRLLNPDVWFAGVGPQNAENSDSESEDEDDDNYSEPSVPSVREKEQCPRLHVTKGKLKL
jgi:hypothetical protein